MKRFLVLLVVLAGGVAWAAFSIPSNAATVNGTSISQADLNSDVSAIANSAYYQCYLNSEEYISSEGSEEAPPVVGAGTGQYAGDHPTATSAFVASYLETDIGHQLALQASAQVRLRRVAPGATYREDLAQLLLPLTNGDSAPDAVSGVIEELIPLADVSPAGDTL